MATVTVNITGNVHDMLDGTFDTRRTKVYLRHNTEYVVDPDAGVIRLGSATVTPNDDGSFELADVIAAVDTVENLQATVYVDYADPSTRTRKTQPFGPYDLSAETGTVDIATDLEPVQHLDASFASETMAAMQALLDEMTEISGLTGEDDAVAYLISNPSDTKTAVIASMTQHVNGFRDMVDKLRNQQQDVNVVVVGDSTSDLTTGGTKWTTGLAAAIGALFPTHTAKERSFDYTTTNDWNSLTTVQTGTGYRADLAGPKVLTVSVAGYAAHNWSDWLVDSRRDKVFGQTSPDVVIIALGHNDGSDNLSNPAIIARDLAYIEWIRQSCPQAQIVLCSQNPRTLTPGHAEYRNDVYRSLARRRGYGYINVTQAFYDDGRTIDGTLVNSSDHVHPTTAGYTLWRDTVLAQIKAATGAVPLPTSAPSFNTLAPRVIGMDTIPVLSNGWTGSNVTEAVETGTTRDGAARSIKLTKTAGGSNSRLDRSVPIAKARGRDVTLTGWVYVPSSSTVTMAGIYIDGSLALASLPDQVMVGQWYPISVTVHVPTSASSVTARLWVDNSTSGSTPSIYVDECDVTIGALPVKATAAAGAVPGLLSLGTWSTGTIFAVGDITSFGGSLYQALVAHTAGSDFRADLAVGNWVHLTGHGRVETIDPGTASSVANTFPVANRAYYFRVTSAAAISKLDIEVGTQSGNLIVGVYQSNGSTGRAAAPGSKIADSGSVGCPAVGFASISLGATVGVAAGDFIMIAADNNLAKFRTTNGYAGASGLSQGRVGYQALGSFAAPSTASVGVWAPTYMPIIIGE